MNNFFCYLMIELLIIPVSILGSIGYSFYILQFRFRRHLHFTTLEPLEPQDNVPYATLNF